MTDTSRGMGKQIFLDNKMKILSGVQNYGVGGGGRWVREHLNRSYPEQFRRDNRKHATYHVGSGRL